MLLPFGYIAPLSIHLQGKSDWFWPSSLWRLLIRIDPAFCKTQEMIGYHWIASCMHAFRLHRPIVYWKSHWFWPSSLWRLLIRTCYKLVYNNVLYLAVD